MIFCMMILWIFFYYHLGGGGHPKTELVLWVIYIHVRVNLQNGDIFGGC